ncbi:unnamed protein product [Choristocarpus tenellus]
MVHAPLAFQSGTFHGFQLRWTTVVKEGCAIVSGYRRLRWMLWGWGLCFL